MIPNQCHGEILLKLHAGHFGIDRTKLRARDSVYWPSINKDIETLIKTCETCQENSKRNAKDPVLAREIPLVSWTLLEMDLFTLEDHKFLLVVDVTSHVPVLRILSNETTKAVLNALKGVYSNFGLPRRVLTDNGPCFKSQEFANFHAKFNINVEKSSAYNHQSVGSVECMVQSIKQIMVKNAENAWLAVLIFRATDIPGINKSPSEILNGRKYRANLPTINIHQRSNETELEKLSKKHLNRPIKGKELPKIPDGTPILYEQNPDSTKIKHPEWCKGTISDRSDPRKYQFLVDNDKIVTRSRHHIKGYFIQSGRVSVSFLRDYKLLDPFCFINFIHV